MRVIALVLAASLLGACGKDKEDGPPLSSSLTDESAKELQKQMVGGWIRLDSEGRYLVSTEWTFQEDGRVFLVRRYSYDSVSDLLGFYAQGTWSLTNDRILNISWSRICQLAIGSEPQEWTEMEPATLRKGPASMSFGVVLEFSEDETFLTSEDIEVPAAPCDD